MAIHHGLPRNVFREAIPDVVLKLEIIDHWDLARGCSATLRTPAARVAAGQRAGGVPPPRTPWPVRSWPTDLQARIVHPMAEAG